MRRPAVLVATLVVGFALGVVAPLGAIPQADRDQIEQARDLLDEWLAEHPADTTTTVAPTTTTTVAPTTTAVAPTTTTVPSEFVAASLNETNTGWRGCGLAESDLTDTGSFTVDSSWPRAADGRIYVERHDVAGFIDVKVPNVTIRCSRIVHGGRFAGVRARYDSANDASGLVVEWTEIDGEGVCGSHAGISSAQTVRAITARRNYIHGGEDGINVQANSLIEQNYINPAETDVVTGAQLPKACGNEHRDAIQNSGTSSWWDSGPVIIRDNRLIGPFQTSTSAIILNSTNGPLGDHVVEGNLFFGGSFTTYARSNVGSYDILGDIEFRGNVYTKGTSGVYRLCVEALGLDPANRGVDSCNVKGNFVSFNSPAVFGPNLWDDGTLMAG